jgi:hypothetical protein
MGRIFAFLIFFYVLHDRSKLGKKKGLRWEHRKPWFIR